MEEFKIEIMEKPINDLKCHVFWLKNTALKSWRLSDEHRQEFENELKEYEYAIQILEAENLARSQKAENSTSEPP
jgi:heme-degrading monooxygenase HmoA